MLTGNNSQNNNTLMCITLHALLEQFTSNFLLYNEGRMKVRYIVPCAYLFVFCKVTANLWSGPKKDLIGPHLIC